MFESLECSAFLGIVNYIRTNFGQFEIDGNDTSSIDDIVRIIKTHKLTVPAYHYGNATLPQCIKDSLAPSYFGHLKKAQKLRILAINLDRMCKKMQTRFVVIKGIGLEWIIYGIQGVRCAGDLDILVEPEDVPKVNVALRKSGFTQDLPRFSNTARGSYAHIALFAHNPDKHTPDFPIKKCRNSIEYEAYYQPNAASNEIIELHDRLHIISSEQCLDMLWSAVRVETEAGTYTTLDPEHALLLLFINTFENSESFISNSHNHDFVLRDYIDLYYFFSKYRSILDWHHVESLIEEFGLRRQASVVLGNLREVYGKNIHSGCLDSLESTSSVWGMGILERMANPARARKASLSVMRKEWKAEGLKSTIIALPSKANISLSEFYAYKHFKEVLYHIGHTRSTLIVTWAIPKALMDYISNFVFQVDFFPLDERISYTSYKIQSHSNESLMSTFGHATEHFRDAVCLKDGGTRLETTVLQKGVVTLMKIVLPFSELGYYNCSDVGDLCCVVSVCKHHFGNFYHKPKGSKLPNDISLLTLSETA
jgi:hypothetical protein